MNFKSFYAEYIKDHTNDDENEKLYEECIEFEIGLPQKE